jgi:hypothetical protein
MERSGTESFRAQPPRKDQPLPALENARQRVNRLLAEGQLSDQAAERLWCLIERRRQQLQVGSGTGPTPPACGGWPDGAPPCHTAAAAPAPAPI